MTNQSPASDSPASSQVDPKVGEESPRDFQEVSPPEHQIVFVLLLFYLLLLLLLLLLGWRFDCRWGDEEQSQELQRKHGERRRRAEWSPVLQEGFIQPAGRSLQSLQQLWSEDSSTVGWGGGGGGSAGPSWGSQRQDQDGNAEKCLNIHSITSYWTFKSKFKII